MVHFTANSSFNLPKKQKKIADTPMDVSIGHYSSHENDSERAGLCLVW